MGSSKLGFRGALDFQGFAQVPDLLLGQLAGVAGLAFGLGLQALNLPQGFGQFLLGGGKRASCPSCPGRCP